jgi:hypothetical protein
VVLIGALLKERRRMTKENLKVVKVIEEIAELNAALSAGYLKKEDEFNPSEELEKTKKLVGDWNKKCLKKI